MNISDINKVKSSGAAQHLLNACTLAKSETVTHIHLILDPQYRALATAALINRLATDFSKTLHHRVIVHVLVSGEISLQMPSKQDKQKSNSIDIPELARISDLERALPFKRSWIYDAIKKGKFPAPKYLSDGITVWPRSSVEAWLAAKVSESEANHDRAAAEIAIEWAKPKELAKPEVA
jgi:predicted DNA-binding transcriptional regulator AlpA